MRADQRAALAEALREVQHAVAVVGHELVQQLDEAHLPAHILDLHMDGSWVSTSTRLRVYSPSTSTRKQRRLSRSRKRLKSNAQTHHSNIQVENCGRHKTIEYIYRARRTEEKKITTSTDIINEDININIIKDVHHCTKVRVDGDNEGKSPKSRDTVRKANRQLPLKILCTFLNRKKTMRYKWINYKNLIKT